MSRFVSEQTEDHLLKLFIYMMSRIIVLSTNIGIPQKHKRVELEILVNKILYSHIQVVL